MSFPIEDKLVIAVSSSALFDLTNSDKVFKNKGVDAYKKYQKDNITHILKPGPAFSFIERMLNLNNYLEEKPIEVVLLSKNDSTTGLRVMNSIEHYGLDITRAAFLRGKTPYSYIESFNVSLFLSQDLEDVNSAIDNGKAAGLVLGSSKSEENSDQVRIAFDFDGVLVNDEAEKIFEKEGLDGFSKHESDNRSKLLPNGPLSDFFIKIGKLQKLEEEKSKHDSNYKQKVRTAIITARNAPAHARVVTYLENYKITVDEVFFLGGINKDRIIKELKPHIFFDDQMKHLEDPLKHIFSVHIPFGTRNN